MLNYNSSTECSGDPSTTQNNVCEKYTDCTATCGKTDCKGIMGTTYSTDDCSGVIESKYNYLPGICIGSSVAARKYTCIGGRVQFNLYSGSANCSNTPTFTTTFDATCTKADGSGSLKFEGCETATTSSTTTSTTSSPSSSTTFTLFGAVITVFITSLFC